MAERDAPPAGTQRPPAPPYPTVGRIVHYQVLDAEREMNNGQAIAPAMIVSVANEGCVNLKVIFDGPMAEWKTSVVMGKRPGCWFWPERV